MSKKKKLLAAIVVICGILLNVAVLLYHNNLTGVDRMVTLEVTMTSDEANEFQVYYLREGQKMPTDFNEGQSSKVTYNKAGDTDTLSFVVPGDTAYVRFDLGNTSSEIELLDVRLKYKILKETLTMEQLQDVVKDHKVKFTKGKDSIMIEAGKNDPYLVWNTEDWNVDSLFGIKNIIFFWVKKIALCLAIDLILLWFIKRFERYVELFKDLVQNRKLIFNLAKSDFKTRFAGSFFGIVWAFVQPIVTVLVYWFVFEKGLKAGGQLTAAGIQVPFVLWLIAGLVPWFFFSEALNGGTNALIEYSYLVKKVVFNISILPVVKVISAVFVHVFFIVFTLILFFAYQYYPDLYILQIFYYSFAMFALTLALVYGTCAIVIFFRDLSQIINIVLQVGVWVTPIMWNIDTMEIAPTLKTIFKMNPLYYVVAGYRDALINKVWFWEKPGLTLYFWMAVAVLFGIGTAIFRRLKVHFADVL